MLIGKMINYQARRRVSILEEAELVLPFQIVFRLYVTFSTVDT
jgi:hypothetical protein